MKKIIAIAVALAFSTGAFAQASKSATPATPATPAAPATTTTPPKAATPATPATPASPAKITTKEPKKTMAKGEGKKTEGKAKGHVKHDSKMKHGDKK
jgi:hypothetical protein